MRLKSQLAAQALEAFESVGLDRTALLAAASLDDATVTAPRGYVDWATFAALLDSGWAMLDRDAERMRSVGGAVARLPSYRLLQRLASAALSLRRIYDIGARWGPASTFPHVSLRYEALSDARLRFHGVIPEPHAPSAALNHIFEGILVELPALVGLPRATIVSSRVTPRTVDVVIDLPRSPSVVARVRRAALVALGAIDEVSLLEEQRGEITDALEEAQRSTEENRALLDRLPDFVIIHREGTLLWMNQANLRALGYERSDEVCGRSLLDLVEPASRAGVLARMRLPAGAEPREASEIRLLSRDGRVVVVEVAPSQEVSFEGRPARLVAARDVTERVRMQQQLLIADRMASIGMLAAGVAHEVNNPLAYVLNNIEIALKDLAPMGEDARPIREVLGVALEGVDRIRTIVRDLLALSRVDDAAIGAIDVVAVVRSTLQLAGKDIDQRAVLTFEHEPVAPSAGSVARLGQVLLNLLTNALEAMRSSARGDNELRVVVRPSSVGGAVVEVSDNGVGVPVELAERVFDPFFTTKPPGRGTGLGLSISQRLVAEMGGDLSFQSTPLGGSTFRVTLPPWEPSSCEEAGRAPSPSADAEDARRANR